MIGRRNESKAGFLAGIGNRADVGLGDDAVKGGHPKGSWNRNAYWSKSEENYLGRITVSFCGSPVWAGGYCSGHGKFVFPGAAVPSV
jgi:hypothetical protein